MHLDSTYSMKYSLLYSPNTLPDYALEQLQWVQALLPTTTPETSTQPVKLVKSQPNTQRQPFAKTVLSRLTPKQKMMGALLVMMATVLPVNSYLQKYSQTQNKVTHVVQSTGAEPVTTITPHLLTVATVQDENTYFVDKNSSHNYEHGFGYDVARGYASHLKSALAVKVFATTEQALKAVQSGQADMVLTADAQKIEQKIATDLTAFSVSCHQDFLEKNGLSNDIRLLIPTQNTRLSHDAEAFLCDKKQMAITEKLAAFYTPNVLKDDYSQQHFNEVMAETLPKLQPTFEQSAKSYNHDWQLLVAMGYQESHLDANAVSPTGVQGIMMLTNDTAKAMGVKDRIDPVQSIQGGAKYLKQLKAQFSDIPESDRLWFALASYNMGPAAVKNIQTRLTKAGRDGTSWAEVYRYMADNTAKNRRYAQCMDYVTNIRGYIEEIKLTASSQQTNNTLTLKSA